MFLQYFIITFSPMLGVNGHTKPLSNFNQLKSENFQLTSLRKVFEQHRVSLCCFHLSSAEHLQQNTKATSPVLVQNAAHRCQQGKEAEVTEEGRSRKGVQHSCQITSHIIRELKKQLAVVCARAYSACNSEPNRF